jgi:protoporphyrin/coproporphyrin ferrochelatase
VLLIGFGGPTRAEEIRPFLDNVLRGRPVPRERYEEVVRHYEHIGGRSPYNDLTMRQAAALEAKLREGGAGLPVAVGMRNWSPSIADAMRELVARGARRLLGFIMAAFQSEASWERYQDAVREAAAELGEGAPRVDYLGPCWSHPLFIRAVAARAGDAFAALTAAERARAHLIFTAHSIPVAMAAHSPYVEQLSDSCRMVADALGRRDWTLAFQSRSGSPREPWLEPEIGSVLRGLGAGAAAVVVPIGFLCDHVEVLYDLDREAAQIARAAGVTMVRASAVNDHPAFIEMMAAMVRERLAA